MEYAKWVFYLALVSFLATVVNAGSMLMGASPKENSNK